MYEAAVKAKTFTCLTSGEMISASDINDFSCDCADGSDEPGTYACPNGQFWAVNLGYRPTLVNASRVNDGVCDTCDGSDEYDGRISCPNTCATVQQNEIAQAAVHQRMLTTVSLFFFSSFFSFNLMIERPI